MNRISQEKIDYINNHLDMPNNKLAEILQIDRTTVRKYKKLQGVIYIPKNFHEYDQYICNNYYTKTSKELAEEIGCSDSYITKVWSENGCKGKSCFTYHFNEDYFKEINSNNKSYILGFLASDGCLYKRDGHQGMFLLQLQKSDKQILQDILKELNSNHPINECGNMATISLVSEKAFLDLNKIGLFPQKTWTIDINLILSNIPKKYWSGFFRGYFDGDGCITSRDQYSTISCTSINYAIPERSGIVFEKTLKNLGLNCKFILDNRKDHYSHNFGRISFQNTIEKYSFLKWIYSNADLKLKRKYILAIDFINKVENNLTNRSENHKAVEYYQQWKMHNE